MTFMAQMEREVPSRSSPMKSPPPPQESRSSTGLACAVHARCALPRAGAGRGTYVCSALIPLYLKVLLLVAQLFQKAPAVKGMAPTQSEPPFLGAELVVMALFVALTIVAAL